MESKERQTAREDGESGLNVVLSRGWQLKSTAETRWFRRVEG